MAIWQDSQGNLHDDMEGAALTLAAWPQGMTLLTDAEVAAARAPTPAQAHAQLQASAQALLDVITGQRGQFARAGVAGILANDTRLAPWQAFVQALRAIANGTDTTSTTLPTQPAYIQGT